MLERARGLLSHKLKCFTHFFLHEMTSRGKEKKAHHHHKDPAFNLWPYEGDRVALPSIETSIQGNETNEKSGKKSSKRHREAIIKVIKLCNSHKNLINCYHFWHQVSPRALSCFVSFSICENGAKSFNIFPLHLNGNGNQFRVFFVVRICFLSPSPTLVWSF